MAGRSRCVDAVDVGLNRKQERNAEKRNKTMKPWQVPGKGREKKANRENTDRRCRNDATAFSSPLDSQEARVAIEKKEECSQRRCDPGRSADPNSVPIAPEPIDLVHPKSAC